MRIVWFEKPMSQGLVYDGNLLGFLSQSVSGGE